MTAMNHRDDNDSTTIGASGALRGYRLQALYTLRRVLEEPPTCSFQLEGREDLELLRDGEVVEAVQVKAYDTPLTLSLLSPAKAEGFFRRVLGRRAAANPPQEKLVSFSAFGTELAKAWSSDGPERHAIGLKLDEHGYTPSEVMMILSSVALERVDAVEVQRAVLAKLRETLVGVDPASAFELLQMWLLRACERRERITQADLRRQIERVGQFIHERAAHYQEWSRSIHWLMADVPDDISGHEEQFYEGVAARYDHIIAGVDVVREDRLREIDEAFADARLVIIHGASGQGKSALAYRYLHDRAGGHWRFEVTVIDGRSHALNIATALLGHLRALNERAYVYIDVQPANTAWPELVRSLIALPEVHTLVTIREEDWKRSAGIGTFVRFRDVELRFEEMEAHALFAHLTVRKPAAHILSFEEAWARFGGGGPLLEFAYFVVRHETLRFRLEEQIQRRRDEVRRGELATNELELLRRVSIASAYGARVEVAALKRDLDLPDVRRTIDLFEREYMLRRAENRRYVEAFHPIRSSLLVELLTDDVDEPWTASAAILLRELDERDLEIFLLCAFSRRRESSVDLVRALMGLHPETWSGVAGATRALLWLGIREYVSHNESLIRVTFDEIGTGWWMSLLPDIMNLEAVAPALMTPLFEKLDLPEARRKELAALRARLTPPAAVVNSACAWLGSRRTPTGPPDDAADWNSAAEVTFLTYHFDLENGPRLCIQADELLAAMPAVSLDTAANVAYALSFAKEDRARQTLARVRPAMLERFQRETATAAIEDDGNTVRVHYLIDFADLEVGWNKSDEPPPRITWNQETMRRVHLLRLIRPDRVAFGGQAYGHKGAILSLEMDATTKMAIKAEHLPPYWLTRWNAVFRELGNAFFRPETWREHSNVVLEIRRLVVERLTELQNKIVSHFVTKMARRIVDDLLHPEMCSNTTSLLERRLALPKSAVDEWGFTGESTTLDDSFDHSQLKPIAFALERHRAYQDALRSFATPLSNFLKQAVQASTWLFALGRSNDATTLEGVRALMKQHRVHNPGYLPATNLDDARSRLPTFQEAFRDRFAGLVGAPHLEEVEEKERVLLRRSFELWCLFVAEPGRLYLEPEKVASAKVGRILDGFREELKGKLRALRDKEVRARIVPKAVSWDGKSALWVSFDIDEPTNLYVAFLAVYGAVQKAILHGKEDPLARRHLSSTWQVVNIVPMVRGKALRKETWSLATIVLCSSALGSAPAWWNTVLHPTPDETWSALGLPVWSEPELALTERLHASFVQLALQTSFLAALEEMPERNETGRAILDQYLQAKGKRISATAEECSERLKEVANYMQSTKDEDSLEVRPRYPIIWDLLVRAHEHLWPEGFRPGELMTLDASDLTAWSERLREAIDCAELARLHWAGDVLDATASEHKERSK
jgi:hypothetical protein